MTTAGRLTVYLEAITTQFREGLAAANNSLKGLQASHGETHKAVTALERGLSGMAGELVGIRGPLEQVTKSLLIFGGGSTAVLGVAAAVTAVGYAMNQLEEDTSKATEAVKALNEERLKVTTVGKVGLVNEDISRLEAGRDQLLKSFGGRTPEAGSLGDVALRGFTDKINQNKLTAAGLDKTADKEHLTAIQKAFDLAEKEETRRDKAMTDAITKSNELWNEASANAQKYFNTLTTNEGLFEKQLKKRGEAMLLSNWDIGQMGNEAVADLGHVNIPNISAPEFHADHTVQQIDALTGSIQLLGSAAGASGNRIGAAIMGAGGIVSALPVGQVAGGVIGLVGAVANLFGGKKSLPVEVTNFDDMRKNQERPVLISNNFVGGTPDQVRDIQTGILRATKLGYISRGVSV